MFDTFSDEYGMVDFQRSQHGSGMTQRAKVSILNIGQYIEVSTCCTAIHGFEYCIVSLEASHLCGLKGEGRGQRSAYLILAHTLRLVCAVQLSMVLSIASYP